MNQNGELQHDTWVIGCYEHTLQWVVNQLELGLSKNRLLKLLKSEIALGLEEERRVNPDYCFQYSLGVWDIPIHKKAE